MKKDTILSFIRDVGIVPVIRTPTAESAIRAIEAIYNGGIRAAEITIVVLNQFGIAGSQGGGGLHPAWHDDERASVT